MKVKLYLMLTILSLSTSSFVAAYVLLYDVADTALNMGINQKTSDLLHQYQTDLKRFGELDPNNEKRYRLTFFEVQDAMIVYDDPRLIKRKLKSSFMSYFFIVFISVLLISVASALVLSKKVSNSYNDLLQNNLKKSKRLQELAYFDNWQQTAASLVHEIKNPLTPIEMMITNLHDNYTQTRAHEFEQNLSLTHKIITEEVARLKEMVRYFGQFSSLPKVHLKPTNVAIFLDELFCDLKVAWSQAQFDVTYTNDAGISIGNIDTQLLKQCFINLVQNAFDANASLASVDFKVHIKKLSQGILSITFSNTGRCLSDDEALKLFQIGYSTHKEKKNRGLGLAIVKKIIIEHDGDIELVPFEHGASFEILLPIITSELSEVSEINKTSKINEAINGKQ